jgi:hypothetical protein
MTRKRQVSAIAEQTESSQKSRERGPTTTKPGITLYESFDECPPEFRAAHPDLAGWTVDSEFSIFVRGRWSEPADPNSDLVDSAIGIIKPTKQKEALCRTDVAVSIRLMRMFAPPKIDAVSKQQLRQLMRLSHEANQLLDKMPPSLKEHLLPSRREDFWKEVKSDGIKMHVQESRPAISHSAALGMEISDLTKAIDGVCPVRKTGPQPDFVKSSAARNAYQILSKYSSSPPTTTAEGAFYRLASILYEGATGIAGLGMERQCRKFLDSERRSISAVMIRIETKFIMSSFGGSGRDAV